MPKAIAITAIYAPSEKIPAGAEFEASVEEIEELVAKGAARRLAPEAEDKESDLKPSTKQLGKAGATGSKS